MTAVAAAVAAWLAAWHGWRVVGAAGVVLVVGVVASGRSAAAARAAVVAMVVGAVVTVATVRSVAGLDPVDATSVDRLAVTLLADPDVEVAGGGVQVDVRTAAGTRLIAEADGGAADVLAGLAAGQQASVSGETVPFEARRDWAVARHLRGELHVRQVHATARGSPASEAARAVRGLLHDGARSLPAVDRALFAGLVFGDDRGQPPELVTDFRASGLAHLLAVSGQNVAFVLVVAGPLLRRLALWPRLLVALAVIVAFAFVTRFEPSVLRASVVAAVALLGRTTGGRSGGVRNLAVAVAVLLVVDPLLTRSLGFQLSVAASLGVVVLAPAVAAHVPGPRWLAEAVGVTIGAQLAVAPVLVPALGPLPLAAVPANVVAAPLAGALMVWGLTAGLVAGLVPVPVAVALHVPSAVGLRVLRVVAEAGASAPLGRIGLGGLAVASVAAVLLWWRPRWSASVAGRAVAVAAAVSLVVAVGAPVWRGPPPGEVAAGFGATVWVDGPVAVVAVGPRASPERVLDALRAGRVRVVGLVVARSAGADVAAVVTAVDARFPVQAVLGPPGLGYASALAVERPVSLRVGGQQVRVEPAGTGLEVRVGRARSP